MIHLAFQSLIFDRQSVQLVVSSFQLLGDAGVVVGELLDVFRKATPASDVSKIANFGIKNHCLSNQKLCF